MDKNEVAEALASRYWSPDKLVEAIRAYDAHRNRSTGELSLGDLLK